MSAAQDYMKVPCKPPCRACACMCRFCTANVFKGHLHDAAVACWLHSTTTASAAVQLCTTCSATTCVVMHAVHASQAFLPYSIDQQCSFALHCGCVCSVEPKLCRVSKGYVQNVAATCSQRISRINTLLLSTDSTQVCIGTCQ